MTKKKSLLRRMFPRLHPTKSPLVRAAVMGVVSRLRRENMRTRHGFLLHIPRDDVSPYVLSLFCYGEYEPAETELILANLRPGDVAIDVGANVGYMTLLMARQVGEGGRVHAFEPCTRHYQTLCENLALNGCEAVVSVNQAAVGSTAGELSLHLAGENQGDHSLVRIPGREVEAVRVVTFDDYRREHCPDVPIRFCKIDVQGFELQVLQGMRTTLAAGDIETVLLELWPARVAGTGVASVAVPELLATLPYDVSVLSHTDTNRDYHSLAEVQAACPNLEDEENVFFNLVLRRRDEKAPAPRTSAAS